MLISLFVSIPFLAAWLDNLDRYLYGVKPGVTINGVDVGRLLPEEVRGVVENLALRHQKLPLEPRIDKETGTIIPEKNGFIVRLDENIEQILNAQEGQKLELQTIPFYPQHTKDDIEKITKVIGQYQTWVSGSEQRHTNIDLAVIAINNSLVWSDEVFSFNETVGPRTLTRGYQPAPIIMLGHTELDFGGGVCQVSSTLFNAAESAGMEIIERHLHSIPIHYVPQGQDAAVSYGYLDLKFQNHFKDPIIIKAGIGGNKLWINIIGREI